MSDVRQPTWGTHDEIDARIEKLIARIEKLIARIEALEAALREIAAMDPKAIRADDLGRAARIARTTLALETDK